MITRAEHDAAEGGGDHVYPVEDVFHEFAPYFVEQVRRDVVERYGNPALLDDGLKVFTTMDSSSSAPRRRRCSTGCSQVDKRQGFRGPLMTPRDAPSSARPSSTESEKAHRATRSSIENNRYYVAPGDRGRRTTGRRRAGGHAQGRLPLLGMRWARKVNPEAYYPGAMITSVKKVLKRGRRHRASASVTGQKDLTDDQRAVPTRGSAKAAPRERAALPAGAGARAAGRAGLHRSRTAST